MKPKAEVLSRRITLVTKESVLTIACNDAIT